MTDVNVGDKMNKIVGAIMTRETKIQMGKLLRIEDSYDWDKEE